MFLHVINLLKYFSCIVRLSEEMIDRMKKPWLWNDMIYFLTKSGKSHKTKLQIVHGFTNKVTYEFVYNNTYINTLSTY